ncbi:hypothetical protein [Nitrosovibrio sp. Nv17]|uniref:hypothetical protein n=1 Tax=Nitrosovibrio sp. Nv17 TaxID=1855339 RepID=UPI00090913A8|nr:hypothetical protein [Nitrosovibrio sp. Nv17]SFW21422.1 hypothetical protein SAMN05216414_10657 [Nitrosovibrio sp. Nv17]
MTGMAALKNRFIRFLAHAALAAGFAAFAHAEGTGHGRDAAETERNGSPGKAAIEEKEGRGAKDNLERNNTWEKERPAGQGAASGQGGSAEGNRSSATGGSGASGSGGSRTSRSGGQ